jgi:hypothetical protein
MWNVGTSIWMSPAARAFGEGPSIDTHDWKAFWMMQIPPDVEIRAPWEVFMDSGQQMLISRLPLFLPLLHSCIPLYTSLRNFFFLSL